MPWEAPRKIPDEPIWLDVHLPMTGGFDAFVILCIDKSGRSFKCLNRELSLDGLQKAPNLQFTLLLDRRYRPVAFLDHDGW